MGKAKKKVAKKAMCKTRPKRPASIPIQAGTRQLFAVGRSTLVVDNCGPHTVYLTLSKEE